MILNLTILIFVIGIAYWQGLQGFFSAFLHLVLVIVSGALAFAFWEPVAMGMLSGMMPRYAWAIGLVMPFVFILMLLRFLMDKFVPANMDFSQLTNLIAGGICGAIAAALSAGICLIGIAFLPGPADAFGYRPYTINPISGEVVKSNEGGELWIQVDHFAESIFSGLSEGSFAPANGKSIARHQPELNRRAWLVRLRGDEYSSTVATPGSVTVTAQASHPTPVQGLPTLLIESLAKKVDPNKEAHRLVAIETQWVNKDKNYDGDPRLRVFPNQVQLITFAKDKPNGKATIHLPIAMSQLKDPTRGNREFTAVSNDAAVIMTDSAADAKITFLFLVPVNEVENFLMVRNLRLPLTDGTKPLPAPSAPEVVALIGDSAASSGPAVATTNGTETPGTVGTKQGGRSGIKAEDLVITADLPRFTSKTLATDLEFTAANEIRRGEMTIKPPTGPISRTNQVNSVYVSDGQAAVRIRLSRDAAQSLLGQAVAAAGAIHPVILRDNRGNDWQPTGYVWVQASSNSMKVRYDPQNPIKAVVELPVRQMGDADELYVYFLVEKGVTLTNFMVGSVHTQEIDRIEVPR